MTVPGNTSAACPAAGSRDSTYSERTFFGIPKPVQSRDAASARARDVGRSRGNPLNADACNHQNHLRPHPPADGIWSFYGRVEAFSWSRPTRSTTSRSSKWVLLWRSFGEPRVPLADSFLEEDGFELPVPRMRGDPRRRAVAGFQLGAAQLLEGLWAYASSRRPRQSEPEHRPRT
jgi:hypothetical protein